MPSIVNDTFVDTAGIHLSAHVSDSGHHWSPDSGALSYFIATGGGTRSGDAGTVEAIIDAVNPGGYAQISFTAATQFVWQVGVGAYTGSGNLSAGTCDMVVLHCSISGGVYELRHYTDPSTFTVIATLGAQGAGTLRVEGGNAILNGVSYPTTCNLTGDQVAILTYSSTFTAANMARITALDAGTVVIPPWWQDKVQASEITSLHNLLAKNGLDIAAPAGSGGTPGTPGYMATETATVCGMFIDGVAYNWVTPTDGSAPQLIPMPPIPTPANATYRCITSERQVYHPYQPPTPGLPGQGMADWIAASNNLGWNAGARSQGFLGGDGSVFFNVQSAIGVAAGLNHVNLGTSYGEITHGFMLSGGLVAIIESGAVPHVGGTFARGDTFKITRLNGVVSYYQNGSLVYTSTAPSRGTVFLDVSMYGAGDSIDTPGWGPGAGAVLALPALAALGGTAIAQAALVLPHLTLASSWAQGAALVLPALVLNGGQGMHASVRAVLPALTVHGEGGYLLPAYTVASVQLPGLQLSGLVLTGQLADGNLSLPKLSVLGADRIYGQARLSLPALSVSSYSYEGNLKATLAQFSSGAPSLSTSLLTTALMRVLAGVAPTMTRVMVALRTLDQDVGVADTSSAKGIMAALMADSVLIAFSESGLAPGQLNSDWQVWSLDWAADPDTAHTSTSYEGYGFNSFARVGNRYFGAQADGIYLLEGDDDAGTPIRGSLNFGRHDLGSAQQKRVPYAYAGVSSNGQLVLRVQADNGEAYLYQARALDEVQKQVRFDIGKGLKGTFFTFELYNEVGSDLDLDSIEFQPIALTRRI